MLDAFIIEEIKRRDRGDQIRPRLELPLPQPAQKPQRSDEGADEDEDTPQRGVIIIDYSDSAA